MITIRRVKVPRFRRFEPPFIVIWSEYLDWSWTCSVHREGGLTRTHEEAVQDAEIHMRTKLHHD